MLWDTGERLLESAGQDDVQADRRNLTLGQKNMKLKASQRQCVNRNRSSTTKPCCLQKDLCNVNDKAN